MVNIFWNIVVSIGTFLSFGFFEGFWSYIFSCICLHWDGNSLLTASALIPNFSFHPSSSPMNQWWTIKSIFGTNFSLAKLVYQIISYYHIIQAIDGRNFVGQNTVLQNIGGRPKISSGKILMVGILLPKI